MKLITLAAERDDFHEEAEEILSTTPHWVLRWSATIICIALLVLLSASWWIRYPDSLMVRVALIRGGGRPSDREWPQARRSTPGGNTGADSVASDEMDVVGLTALRRSQAERVRVGQIVEIEVDGYSVTEFGTIAGKIAAIEPIDETRVGLRIRLPRDLKTSHGATLTVGARTAGTGRILTPDRRLAERLLDRFSHPGKSLLARP